MSAFVMSEEFFGRLVGELSYRINSPNDSNKYDIREFIKGEHGETDEDYEVKAIVTCQELFNANVAAVNDRYEEDDIAGFVEPTLGLPKWSDLQMIKYLKCLRYQMSEGDVMESEIYKRLDTFIGGLCENLVGRMPGYESASWDYAGKNEVAYA